MVHRKRRNDRLAIGFWLGMGLPVIIFVIMFFIKDPDASFSNYLKNLWQFRILIKLMSLCVFPNLLIFMFFYRRKYDMAARGVIMATFVYAFVVLISTII